MKTIHDVWSEFNPLLVDYGQVVIAGGSVRDHLLGKEAKDFDVFVLWRDEWSFEIAREEIGVRLSDRAKVDPLVEWHISEPFLISSVSWDGVEVQVMANPAKNLPDLIKTFDWNVSLFGFDGDHISGDVSCVGKNKDLILQTVTYPTSTLRRGFRFSERFLMRLRNEDVELICSKVIGNAEKRMASTVPVPDYEP